MGASDKESKQQKIRSLKHLLQESLKVLREHDVPTCLAYGTLLGKVRNGKIIPHDDDIDVLIDVSKRDTVERIGRTLRETGSNLYMVPRKNMVRLIYKDPKNGKIVRGDIFYYKRAIHTGTKCIYVFQEDSYFPYAQMFPMIQTTMYGQTCYIPGDPHAWLKLQYGPDYMTPMDYKGRASLWTYAKLACKHPWEKLTTQIHELWLLYPQHSRIVLLILLAIVYRVLQKKFKC